MSCCSTVHGAVTYRAAQGGPGPADVAARIAIMAQAPEAVLAGASRERARGGGSANGGGAGPACRAALSPSLPRFPYPRVRLAKGQPSESSPSGQRAAISLPRLGRVLALARSVVMWSVVTWSVVTWSRGHVVTWSVVSWSRGHVIRGHVVSWSRGPWSCGPWSRGPWSLGHVVTWSRGPWSRGHVVT